MVEFGGVVYIVEGSIREHEDINVRLWCHFCLHPIRA